MRGVVTLAAAFALPEETPERPVLVLAAMSVTVGTLLLQGLTLPWLARRLGVRGPDPREDALQEATILQASVAAGLKALEEHDEADEETIDLLRGDNLARAMAYVRRLAYIWLGHKMTPPDLVRDQVEA